VFGSVRDMKLISECVAYLTRNISFSKPHWFKLVYNRR